MDQYHTDEYILSPFILSAIFHYTIIKEDIFPEYNRAFARLFSFLVLLRGKYDKSIYFSLEEKITKSRGNYEKSIDHVRNGKDATPAIKFFLHLLFSSLTDTTERFQQEQQMKDIYKDMLDFVQKNKLSQFAAKDIKPFVKKDMRTVRRYLKEMCDIKLIEKHGDKKGTYYTVLAH
ncbi:MAG: hypothetical protein U9Q15_01980 [Patescibacteria group bacterium]|nr:hypothetical protein [Patescibacteria group bacterium]